MTRSPEPQVTGHAANIGAVHAWKLLWLGIVALPLWLDNQLEGATRVQTAAVLWVGIIIAVIPWRHVLRTYVLTRGEPWRRSP